MGTRATAMVGESTTLEYEFRQGPDASLFDPAGGVVKVEILRTDLTLVETITPVTRLGVGRYRVVAAAADSAQTMLDRIFYKEQVGQVTPQARLGQFQIAPLNIAVDADRALMNAVRSRLGSSMVTVELSDNDIDVNLTQAKRWYAGWAGHKKEVEISLSSGIDTYEVADDAAYVVKVIPPGYGSAMPSLGGDVINSMVFGAGQMAGGNMGLGEFSERMSYIETAGRVVGQPFDWSWDQNARRLRVFGSQSGTALVRYVSSTVDLAAVDPQSWDLIFRMVVALSKQTLGRALRKFSAVPSASGSADTDGDALYNDGLSDEAACREEIKEMGWPAGMVTG